MSRRHLLAGLAAAAAVAGCAPNTTDRVKHEYAGTPPLGAPILDADLPAGQWTWIDFPDTSCGDGTSTGLGINRGTGQDLLVFFDGGGACWSYETCAVGTATHKAYGSADFAADVTAYLPGSILDRTQLPPTLAGATVVFVPYCTGDVHGGDTIKTYTAPLASETWHHVGHENLKAFLKRLGATWPSPRKVVVAGSSAGGFGALSNYEAFRWYWPAAQGYLVDDSGPPLVGDDIPAAERDAWYNAWNLGVALDAFCVGCRTDLSDAVAQLSRA
ncbi:MAG TPA: pectin acetylesterase-family hydrolase, partial [Anaeromyxobacteraceae bacterium]|nr:pectin acetylesterase-family hydrolase [Anaeromyxobacteraceae bacterium]